MQDPIIADLLAQELHRQREGIELIASENFTSANVMAAMGSGQTGLKTSGHGHRSLVSCGQSAASFLLRRYSMGRTLIIGFVVR